MMLKFGWLGEAVSFSPSYLKKGSKYTDGHHHVTHTSDPEYE